MGPETPRSVFCRPLKPQMDALPEGHLIATATAPLPARSTSNLWIGDYRAEPASAMPRKTYRPSVYLSQYGFLTAHQARPAQSQARQPGPSWCPAPTDPPGARRPESASQAPCWCPPGQPNPDRNPAVRSPLRRLASQAVGWPSTTLGATKPASTHRQLRSPGKKKPPRRAAKKVPDGKRLSALRESRHRPGHYLPRQDHRSDEALDSDLDSRSATQAAALSRDEPARRTHQRQWWPAG